MKKLYVLIVSMMLLPGCELLAKWGLGPGSGLPKDDPVMMDDEKMTDDNGDAMTDDDKKEGEWTDEEMKAMEGHEDDMMNKDEVMGDDKMTEDKAMEGDTMEKDESAMMNDKVEGKYAAGVLNDYSAQAFAAAVADGKKVMLDFYADWCPICRGNAPLIDAAITDSDVVGFKVDYDNETALKQQYGVTTQSTLIIFNGETELARVVGVQTDDSIKSFLSS